MVRIYDQKGHLVWHDDRQNPLAGAR